MFKEMERMDFLDFIARVTSHIPDKGQVTVRYYGLYANAHRGKIKKTSHAAFPLRIVEEELRRLPAKGWAEMIRKVYEVDPLTCPKCGATMKIIAFLADYARRGPHHQPPQADLCRGQAPSPSESLSGSLDGCRGLH
jgi:hypothetical protein